MKRVSLLSAAFLLCTFAVSAQETGNWRAANQTAKSITGDIGISPEKIFINFARFTMSRIRALRPAEVAAAFEADSATAGAGSLYRLSIPPEQKFLHKNTLCGSDETQWMATYVEGKTLKVAFFSNAAPPVFTLEALQNSPNLCGTFTYVK
ncbi:MAG: hypothetical protein JST61_06415 [Acidobacteria bacterium]|nr:hypothetical protein [Acidobacteriota bacterium]